MAPKEHVYYADGDEHRRLRSPIDEGLAGVDEHKVSRATRTICREVIRRRRVAQ